MITITRTAASSAAALMVSSISFAPAAVMVPNGGLA